MHLLVRETDIERVARLMQAEWLDMVQREGTAELSLGGAGGAGEEPEGELPCPACGTAAPLDEGACTDCGLQLE